MSEPLTAEQIVDVLTATGCDEDLGANVVAARRGVVNCMGVLYSLGRGMGESYRTARVAWLAQVLAEREEQVRADEREACCRDVCGECRISHELGADDLRYEDGIGWHHYYGGEGPTWRGCKCEAAAIRGRGAK
mgnify:CR=1 FL=1